MSGLVNTPEAEDFITSLMIDSGLKLAAGDPKVDATVAPDIQAAHIALRQAGKNIMALATDPTRNDVQRHEVAKKIAMETEAKVERARVALEERAKYLMDSAVEEADRDLGPKAPRGAIESELRGWVREQNKHPNGLETIKKAMAENVELAGVLYSSPRFLLGLSASMGEKLKFEAVQIHRPELYAKMSNSVGLTAMAERCKQTARKIHNSFYNRGLADQAKNRVQSP
jgi:hypothetical protein